MSTCPSCEAEFPPGSRWCAICHVSVANPQIGRLAPPIKRLIAFAIDVPVQFSTLLYLWMGSLSSAHLNTSLSTFLQVVSIAFLVYVACALFLCTKGTTPGKKLLGMRVVKEDGRNADFFTMLIRETVGRALSCLVFFLGFLWMLIDKDNQAWHDKLLRTYVVESVK